MIDHAVRVFRRIPDHGLRHTERSLCAILTAFLKNHKLDLLLKTFQSAPEYLQISPGITAHNIVLNALCTHGDVAGARTMLREMEKKGVKPDLLSYNMLLTGYLKKGEQSGFDDVLSEMFAEGLATSVDIYNSLILELCANKRTSEAEELLDVMLSNCVRPIPETFNAIIEGFCKEGDVTAAMGAFKRKRSMLGAVENVHVCASLSYPTYVLLLRSLVEKGDIMSALGVARELIALWWLPPIDVGRWLREGLEGDDLLEYSAKWLDSDLRDLIETRIAEDKATSVDHYTSLILVLCKNEWTFVPEKLVDVLLCKGVGPNKETFNAIIDGFCKEGDVTEAMGVFRSMRRMLGEVQDGCDSVSLSPDTYILLVRRLVEKGDFISGMEVAKELKSLQWHIPNDLFRQLTEGLAKQRFSDAKDEEGGER